MRLRSCRIENGFFNPNLKFYIINFIIANVESRKTKNGRNFNKCTIRFRIWILRNIKVFPSIQPNDINSLNNIITKIHNDNYVIKKQGKRNKKI